MKYCKFFNRGVGFFSSISEDFFLISFEKRFKQKGLNKQKKMFSGLTNQVSSWMGQVKGGENHDEEVPTPTVVQTSEPLEQTQSPQQQQPNLMEPQEENVALGDEEDKKQRFVIYFFFVNRF